MAGAGDVVVQLSSGPGGYNVSLTFLAEAEKARRWVAPKTARETAGIILTAGGMTVCRKMKESAGQWPRMWTRERTEVRVDDVSKSWKEGQKWPAGAVEKSRRAGTGSHWLEWGRLTLSGLAHRPRRTGC